MIHKRISGSYSDFYDTQRHLCVMDAMQKGFSRSNLLDMIRSAEVYPDKKIVHALSGQLSWTHFREIIYIKDYERKSIILAPTFIGFYTWLIDPNVITGIQRRVAVE